MSKQVTLFVNSTAHEILIKPQQTLLDILRNDLGLTGTHRGCDRGSCGSCTVHRNGLPVASCLVLGIECNQDEILTIEGISSDGVMHPLQEAFVRLGAIQCGFCSPGMIMCALALLDDNPLPSEAAVRSALGGNLCRCTGYTKIVEAVLNVERHE